MLIVGVDVETTGLDIQKERIIEFAYAVWCTERHSPLLMHSHMVGIAAPTIDPAITKLTGIDSDMLLQFGKDLKKVLAQFVSVLGEHKIQHGMAYNGRNFDIPLIDIEAKRVDVVLPPLMWIDPVEDLPLEPSYGRRKLAHMAADHGFLNPFPHRALFDVLTMFKIADQYPTSAILERAASPTVVARALIQYEDTAGREIAKKKGFRFNELDGKRYEKQWVRKIKECDMELFQKEVPFKIAKISNG